MALQLGRQGQIYLKKEAAYGVEEALAATNALRHINVGFAWDPFARETSSEKQQSPRPVNRFDRKQSAGLSTLVGLLRPSGTLNTLPECDPVLEAGLGPKTNVTLATTVSAAPAPTTTGATVASAAGLVVGDAVLIEVTGQSSSPFVRVLTAIAGAALTWAPALPAAPSTGDDLKGTITYKLSTGLAISLTMMHALTTFKRELTGLGIDSLALAFDANAEPQFTASGPAAAQLTGTAQAKPGSFTTVGGNPPSGLIGETLINGTAYLMKTLGITITNGLAVRNQEYGVNKPSEIYRSARSEIAVSLDAFVDNEATLYDLAEAGTNSTLMHTTGRTEGKIVALYAPKVEWKVPDQDDPDTEASWSFSGMALDTVDAGNDAVKLIIA